MKMRIIASPIRALVSGALLFSTATITWEALAAETPPLMLDLAPFYDPSFSRPNYKGPGIVIPPEPVFDGLPFKIGGQVRFFGRTLEERNQVLQEKVEGIAVGRAFAELHLIHHAFWPDVQDRAIARVRLNYSDGSHLDFLIRYGGHVMDWFRLPSEEQEVITDPDTKIIWRGEHPGPARLKATARLFKSTFINPHPDKLVRTLDVISERQQASYSLIAATVAGRDPNRPQTPPVPPLEPARQFTGAIKVRVLNDETGKPIQGALVVPSMSVDGAGVVAPQPVTTAAGEAVVRYPEGTTQDIWMEVQREGYARASASWDHPPFPAEHTFRLQPASTVIGGVVKDDSGKPVQGVKVWLESGFSDDGTVGDAKTSTDARGRWTLAALPKGVTDFRVALEHPDFPKAYFLSDQSNPAILNHQRVSLRQLLSQTAELQLARGLTLAGVVVNSEGTAVANAKVLIGFSRYSDEAARGETGADGKFEVPNLKPGSHTLTVQAPRCAPEMREITLSAETEPLNITLEKGRTVKGRVVNTADEPVAGARVSVESWRGKQTLQWTARTDEDGRFTWGAAPSDAVSVSILQEGFAVLRNVTFRADGELETFTLRPPMSVSGTVLDAETKAPIATFRVVPGQIWGNGPYHWHDHRATTGRAGQFTITLNEPQPQYVFKIEAAGYLPGLSSPVSGDELEPKVTVELKKGEGPAGVVRLADGRLAEGAEVILVTRGGYHQLTGRKKFVNTGGTTQRHLTKTDERGFFRLQPEADIALLAVAHEEGFSETAAENIGPGMEVRLQPWGRIEGELRNGKQPAPNETLLLFRSAPEPGGLQYTFNDFKIETDRQGRFILENVPPGEQRLARLVSMGTGRWMHSHPTRVTIQAGGTTRLVIGGTGRAVAGKVIITEHEGVVNWAQSYSALGSRMPKPPQTVKSRAEYEAWASTPEMKEARANHRTYALRFEPDGSFRIEDVEPGEYDLRLTFMKPTGGTPLANDTREITIGAAPRGDESPLNLGTIEIKARRDLKVGDLAPEFNISTLDGEPLKFADYRGKYVLLDFWATWCGPCVAELPHLKETYEAFGNDERFAMIALSLDADANAPREFAKKHDLKWIQGFLGDWSKATVPSDYGVSGIPATFLIGPDGKIIAKSLRGGAVKTTVEAALRK